jgi:hypothetical protein
VFERLLGTEKVWCAFNLGESVSTVDLPGGQWSLLDVDVQAIEPDAHNKVVLPAWGYTVLSRKS